MYTFSSSSLSFWTSSYISLSAWSRPPQIEHQDSTSRVINFRSNMDNNQSISDWSRESETD